MMMVASVGSIAQLSDSATFGLGAVTVYLIPALLFLLPVGLVSAELATSHEGGIFVWVREAFGDRTGFQATWFVFMNSVTLYPSLLSFGAAALATAFGRPDLAGNGPYMGAVVLVGFWLATFVVSKGMQTTAGLSNLGVGLGTIVPAFALIFFMFAWLIDSKPSATPLELSDRHPAVRRAVQHRPGRRHLRGLRGARGQRGPHQAPQGPPAARTSRRCCPRPLLVFVMYMLGSIAISVAVPDATLELTSGASQAFTVYADGFGIPGLSNVLSGLLVLGAVAASIAWIAGPSRSMWLVGRAGYLPQPVPEGQQERRADADPALPGRHRDDPVAGVRGRTEHLGRLRDAPGHLDHLVHVHVHLHVRLGHQAAPVPARRRAPDPDHRPPGHRLRRHRRRAVGDRAGPHPARRLQRPAGRPVRRHHRRRRPVLAIPAQLLHHFRRPEWTTVDEAEIAAELEE